MKNPIQREDAHTEEMEKYKALYENAPLPYQSLDVDGCFKDVNPAFLRTLGYEREEIIGKFFGDFLDPESKAHFKKNFAEFKRQGSTSNVEFKILHKKGHWLDVSFEGNIAYNADGSFKQTYCAFQDISTRQSADKALRENEKLLRTIAENYPNSYISIIEKDLTVSFASGQEFKNRKLDPEQFMGLTLNQVFGNQAAIVKKHYKKTFKGEACSFELFIDEQHQLYRTVPLVSDDGAIHRILTVVENITQRVKAEEELNSLLQHLETAQEMAELGYYERNLSTNKVFWSKGMYKVLGFKPDDIKQTADAFMELIHPDDREAEIKNHRAAITADSVFESEFRYIKRDGNIGWIHNSGNSKKNKQGQMIIRGTMQDITQRHLEKELEALHLQVIEYAFNHSIDELLQKTLDEAENITGSKIGFYHFVSEDQENVELQTWSTNTKASMCKMKDPALHYPISQAGVWVDCIHERKAVIHNDYSILSNKKGFPEGHPSIIRELLVPIIRNKKVMAILGLGNKLTDYTNVDVVVVQRIANTAWETIERKQTEGALFESERRLSTLMGNMPGMAYRCHNDANWTMEFISMGCMALTGYKPSDLLENKNKAYTDLIHPDDRKMVWTTVQNSLAKKESFEMEYRILTAKGKQKFVLEMGTGLFEGEQIQFLEGFITDITERKQAEEKIKKDQYHLEALVTERTKDIKAKNKELERFNKLFVGREFRIKELKDRVKELEKQIQ